MPLSSLARQALHANHMATEKDIVTIRNSDGRGVSKVLVLERCAGGKLLTVVRADGLGTGARFVVETARVIEVRN